MRRFGFGGLRVALFGLALAVISGLAHSQVVISQAYGGGGNSGAPFNADYVELFNRGTTTASVAGWSVQYASSTGTSWSKVDITSGSIPAGGYFLVKLSGTGVNGSPLPTPDIDSTLITASGTNGKLALLNTTTAIASGTSCPTGATIVDFVGYGTSNCFEGAAATGVLSNTTAAIRAGSGCTDTNNNGADFTVAAPAPRNSATAVSPCAGPPTNPAITAGSATPGSIPADGATQTVIRLTVVPGTNPPSTGLAVTLDLAQIGGSATAALRDDGAGCDAVNGANNNDWCLATTAAVGTVPNIYGLPAVVTDAQSRSGVASASLTVIAPASINPSGTGSVTPGTIPNDGATASTLRVVVTPGQFPTSTGLGVTVDLAQVGGAASVALIDSGTGCDATAADNNWCTTTTAAPATPTATYALPFTITDAQARTGSGNVSLTVGNAPTPPSGVVSVTPVSIAADGLTPTTLRVAVTPGANPVSSGISVTANLTPIGGGAAVALLDNGSSCDATAGDLDFCVTATAAIGTAPGNKTLIATITDAQARTATPSASLDVIAPPTLTVAPASVTVGQAGNQVVNVVVSLAPTRPTATAFQLTTAGGTAIGGSAAPADYQPITAQTFSVAANAASANVPVTIFANLRPNAPRSFDVTIATSEGGVFVGTATATVTINNDAPANAPIPAIQGSGAASPLGGTTVNSTDNIVTAVVSNGFTIQARAPGDGNPATSDAMFVFTAAAPTVVVGDVVDLRGRVGEFNSTGGGRTLPGTQFFNVTPTLIVNRVGSANVAADTAAFALDAAIPSPIASAPACVGLGGSFSGALDPRVPNFACFEYMRVATTSGAISAPSLTFGSDPTAEMGFTTSGARAFRSPGVAFPVATENVALANLVPSAPALPPGLVWSGNPHVFEFDPDRLGLPNAAIAPGSTLSAQGILGIDFGDYEFWPNQYTVTEAAPALPRPVPAPAADQLAIGSLNLLNLFDLCDDPARPNSNETFNVATTNRKLEKLSRYIRTVLSAPDVLGVQEAEQPSAAGTACVGAGPTTSALQLLADRIVADGGPSYTVAYGAVTNDPRFIAVGVMYRSDLGFTGVSLTQLAATEQFTFRYLDGQSPPVQQNRTATLHDRPPLRFEAAGPLAGGGTQRFAVIVNHFRSLSGIDDLRDTRESGAALTDPTFRQDAHRVRQKRLLQAISVGCQVQAYQSNPANAGVPLILVGDHNAFEFSDGYADVNGVLRGAITAAESEYAIANYFAPGELPCATVGGQIVNPGLEDAVLALPQGERYSFIFQNSAQTLDHGLLNVPAQARFEGIRFGRGNADAPKLEENNASSALASSDHDGLVLYFNASATRPTRSGFTLFGDSFEAP